MPSPSQEKMKPEEQIALDYLHNISSDVVYEPDDKIPPDFKLNQVIAVEVRRLNQNILVGTNQRGLEQEQIKLWRVLSGVLREFDSPIPTESFWISLHFKRPVGKMSSIESAARRGFLCFINGRPQTPFQISLSRNVSITITKTNRNSKRVFDFGIQVDQDSGGWVGPLYLDNINHCIEEKSRKVKPHKAKYSEWWLVLVDYLAGGIGEPEKTYVVQHINRGDDWKKIIVIDPRTKKEILKIGSSDLIVG
jgi:hypothetical protein